MNTMACMVKWLFYLVVLSVPAAFLAIYLKFFAEFKAAVSALG